MALLQLFNTTLELYKGKLHILLVDDVSLVRQSLCMLLSSPVLQIHEVESFQDAQALVSTIAQWHCWVLDIDLGKGKTGLDVMALRPSFPFVIILSGLRSMLVASQAMLNGAQHVFDKDPKHLEKLRSLVCRLSVVGYLMQGTASQYFATYRLLLDNTITTIDAWAGKACITTRQLYRICELHGKLSPLHAIHLYFALTTVAEMSAKDVLTLEKKEGGEAEVKAAFVEKCLGTAVALVRAGRTAAKEG